MLSLHENFTVINRGLIEASQKDPNVFQVISYHLAFAAFRLSRC